MGLILEDTFVLLSDWDTCKLKVLTIYHLVTRSMLKNIVYLGLWSPSSKQTNFSGFIQDD